MPTDINLQMDERRSRWDAAVPLRGAPPRRAGNWYARVRPALDFTGAAVLLVLSAPVVLTAALLVKLTSRGPAFYRQTRLGKDGRPYTILKIRTMSHDCERTTGPRWAMPNDPRVTRVGHFLRRTHVDELPQLWNVLRGEMSLVGPRPERPEMAAPLERAFPAYRDRLRVRPGMTGLAQVQLPADTDLASVRRKLACDLYYVRAQGFWLDFRILLSTGAYLLGIPFHWTRRLLALPGQGSVAEPFQAKSAEPSPVTPAGVEAVAELQSA
jgi:lipopolysaccharide/colanic/teichoic acid biosynthesis glycosyltransferase